MLQARVQNDTHSGQHILFAEDDAAIANLVDEVLRSEGFTVTMADSGDTAATILETGKFHLLLTDVRMPGIKDGIDLAIHAQQKHPQLPIVIVSGYAEGLNLRVRKLRGRVTLLSKPFLINELIKAIKDGLNQIPAEPIHRIGPARA